MALSKEKLDNLKELYNSLQYNLSDVSKLLNEKHLELRTLIENCKEARLELDKSKEELEAHRQESKSIDERISHRQLELEQEEHSAQQILRSLNDEIVLAQDTLGIHQSKINNKAKEIDILSQKHEDLSKIFSFTSSGVEMLQEKSNKLSAEVAELSNNRSELERVYNELRISNKNEILSHIEEKNKILEDIRIARQDYESFAISKRSVEESLAIRASDLSILENRIKNYLKELNLPYKL